eukprot:TRINITY_DN10126_c0_g1_i2.p1 TRINITY_DN10126_c0_g1~~TRINITY_DN10126_c0_g1_i2.p1  ORF type:complete len:189 (+),score=4.78 TRINITY_DN10126_c0_g1_i2:832-1398(+)
MALEVDRKNVLTSHRAQRALFLLLLLLVSPWSSHPGDRCAAAVSPAEVKHATAAVWVMADIGTIIHNTLDIIVQLVSPLSDATILLPLSPGVLSFVLAAYPKEKQDKIFNYHIIKGNYSLAAFMNVAGGTELPTQEGMPLIKRGIRGQPMTMFQGRSLAPSMVVMPNIWSGSTLQIHGISTVLIPPDL